MTRARLSFAGLTVIAAMMAGDACAQSCPEWLTLACPGESLNVAAEEGAQQVQGVQLARTNATASSAAGRTARPATLAAANAAANPQPQQTQAPQPARPAKTARPAMNDPEKEALFRQFLAWRKERLNTETSR